MLLSENPVWRRFWHAIIPVDQLRAGPRPFRLLGEDIVVFLDEAGNPVALADRCRHRTTKLSKGWVADGRITCAYHGWQYDGTGRLRVIPQYDAGTPVPDERVQTFRCQARYGYVWVALDDPVSPLFDIPEDRDPGFRRIQQFYDTWATSPLRLIENSFDNAHFSFVHKGTFGNIARPKPGRYAIGETEQGFYAEAVTEALNPPAAHPVSGSTAPTVERLLRSSWYLPFARRFDMEYVSGIRHIIFTYATPIDDSHIQVAQFLYRNDTEAQCPAQLLVDWDARIFAEDKDVLEATDPDVLLDVRDRGELHMPSDRPSVIMRKRLHALLAQYPAHPPSSVRTAA
ncbi:MAG: aromatic ring-hydroxylating dioxygenase subunit alpha [Pigmentiphaga sp.]|uniref:aromatic ring-hydroxylating dioxygenase subunit alpha n=1 Tax=Pigmentiphaga sp. TaxID=1977564 RepID=UPI0029ABF7CE|nr:aromatic ring-hydroxylating dioxygenase subunit alpha [Pigmentiphaga sp.]MDX3905709.1 aromatic ring-hydroxylating dioxygenase subunit alpha [Pigmentiphaga sp.]